jgi:hypothetical protein
MQGILAGCWVVTTGWVTACLEAGAQLLPEEPYEVLGDGSSSNGSNGGGCGGRSSAKAPQGGPAKGRQHKAQGLEPLLAGWQVFVLGSGAVKESCTSLVKAAGGAVVARLPPAPFPSQQQGQLGVGSAGEPEGQGGVSVGKMLALLPEGASGGGGSKGQLAHAEALGVPVLGQKWLMDCVSHMQLLPMEGFRVQG